MDHLLESILDVSPEHLNIPINIQLLSSSVLLSFSVLCMSVDIFNTFRGGNGGDGGRVVHNTGFAPTLLCLTVDTNL